MRLDRFPRPLARVARVALCAAIAFGAFGCGVWLGDEETLLQGERVAIRQAAVGAPTGGVAQIPSPTPVGDWPQAGGAPHRSLGNISGSTALTRLWTTSIGAGSDSESRVTAPPVAVGGKIYALDAAAQLTAVSAAGDQLWRADLAPEDEDGRDGFGGGLAVAGGLVFASTGFGQVVALEAGSGAEKWRFQATAPIRSAPAVSRGRVVVVTRDGVVVCLDAASGQEVWRVVGIEGGASIMGGGGSAPAISGEVVAAPFASGDIGVIRLSDGRRGWTEPIGGATRGAAIALISDVSSAPVMAEGRIFAGAVSGRLVSFDIAGRRRVWARSVGAYNPVWVAGDALFVVTEEAKLMALNAGSGGTIWETPLERFKDAEDRSGPIAYGGPIMVAGKLILTSSDEKLLRVDAATGKLEAEIDMPGPSSVPPIVAGGVVYVVDQDGDLSAYR